MPLNFVIQELSTLSKSHSLWLWSAWQNYPQTRIHWRRLVAASKVHSLATTMFECRVCSMWLLPVQWDWKRECNTFLCCASCWRQAESDSSVFAYLEITLLDFFQATLVAAPMGRWRNGANIGHFERSMFIIILSYGVNSLLLRSVDAGLWMTFWCFEPTLRHWKYTVASDATDSFDAMANC